ncbi:MAG: XdhC/CoxI family protein [Thermodesulfobacteriota bacterium]|nr:XdhC/CoxI family protein [Thermodesulfobacteriota bacterium]
MIEKEILTQLKQNRTVALVTIIDKNGSAPRLPGSKMFVEEDGTLHGTIGGGRMEFTAHEAATKVANGDPPVLTEFDMRGSGSAEDTDMVCGGIQLVLIERLTSEMIPMFEQALDCFLDGATGVWMIDISDPEHPLRSFIDMRKSSPPAGDIDCKAIMRQRTTQLLNIAKKSIVIDPLPKSGTVVLIGGGHVSKEVAKLASYVDFEVVVCDDRQEFSNTDRFPMARATHVIKDFQNLFQTIGQGEDYYLLIITRGHRYDQEALDQALQTPARYIGMIGSRSKRDITYSNLRDQGFTDADFARVHCPVGLSIGSETPKEIAVSIIAELIAARSGAL